LMDVPAETAYPRVVKYFQLVNSHLGEVKVQREAVSGLGMASLQPDEIDTLSS
jgi:hypothetical protein